MKSHSRREKTNPHGSTAEPWISRTIELVEWRCLVREALDSRNEHHLTDLENKLASFAPFHVRGDYVPTIADAYAEAVELANKHQAACDAAVKVTLPAALEPQVQTILTDAGAFRVEVRFVPVTPKKQNL